MKRITLDLPDNVRVITVTTVSSTETNASVGCHAADVEYYNHIIYDEYEGWKDGNESCKTYKCL